MCSIIFLASTRAILPCSTASRVFVAFEKLASFIVSQRLLLPARCGIDLGSAFSASRNSWLRIRRDSYCMTPPLAAAPLSCRRHVRGASQMARQEECEAIMGALLTAKASANVFIAACECRPLRRGGSFRERRLCQIGESVMNGCRWRSRPLVVCRYREGHVAHAESGVVRRTARSLSIMWPPSTPISAAIWWFLCASRTSEA